MKILILTGGSLDLAFACSYIKQWKPDQIITADKGLVYARQCGIEPDVILGDFDSCDKTVMDEFSTEQKILVPCEKDDTDTGLAMQKAIEMGADEILILGATGTRLDHVMGNMGQLVFAARHGVFAQIVDPCNRISVVKNGQKIRREGQFGKYISLIPVYEAKGVTLKGFKYPLNNDTLVFHESWGISNELEKDEGSIYYKEGILLLIESKD